MAIHHVYHSCTCNYTDGKHLDMQPRHLLALVEFVPTLIMLMRKTGAGGNGCLDVWVMGYMLLAALTWTTTGMTPLTRMALKRLLTLAVYEM